MRKLIKYSPVLIPIALLAIFALFATPQEDTFKSITIKDANGTPFFLTMSTVTPTGSASPPAECTSDNDSKIFDPGNVPDGEISSGDPRALQVTFAGQVTVTGIFLSADDGGGVSHEETCELWSDSAGSPDAIVDAAATSVISDLADSGTPEREYIFASPVVVSAGTYWAVCDSTGSGSQDYGKQSDGTGTYKYLSGTWQTSTYKIAMGVLGCE